jgi:hypothetical protein
MIKTHLQYRGKGLVLDSEYQAIQRRKELLRVLLALVLETVALVAVTAFGTVCALQFIEKNPGFYFVVWAAFTGVMTGAGFLLGGIWPRIKDWLF